MKPALTCSAALRLASLTIAFGLSWASVGFGADPLEGFLEKHCIRCHGSAKVEGDVRIDKFSRDFKSGADAHHWGEVLDRINSGQMPPKDEPKPKQDEIAAFVTHLDSRLKEGRAARMAARSAVSHYRLSRKE